MTSPRDLSVASYNIHKGIGTDRRRDLARTVAVISEIGAGYADRRPAFAGGERPSGSVARLAGGTGAGALGQTWQP